MLGADGRPVAPDLAPAFGPFDVDDADENERPIAKRPERDPDRPLDWHPECERLDERGLDRVDVIRHRLILRSARIPEKRRNGARECPGLQPSSPARPR